jgi:membrane associated rhomboid family serine protease
LLSKPARRFGCRAEAGALNVDIVEVYHSFWRPSCEERAFMLHAVGIASQTAWNGRSWSLYVAVENEFEARSQLGRYDRENPPRGRPAPPDPLHRRAWTGSLAYAGVLLLVGFLAGTSTFNIDWLDAGSLRTAPLRGGELWRAVTALTLHLDVGHLLANLGFGTVFGLLAGQLLGPGVAWASVLAAAASANLLNASVQPEMHASVGASTAVFATLGLLAAYAWRRRSGTTERRAYRWAPLFAGVFLLAFTGAGGENTDVLAHLTGFAMGALAGVLHAAWRGPRSAAAQLLAGALALATIVAAWAVAIANA